MSTEEQKPPRACPLGWLTLYLSHVAGRALSHDEVIAQALAEMADRAMADVMGRALGGVARRRDDLALMIPMGRA